MSTHAAMRCRICRETPSAPPTDAARVRCNVRAFRDGRFEVWRCPRCRCLNSGAVVDLDHYYSCYPFARARLNWALRFVYRYQLRRLRRAGFARRHTLLDYGCGNGMFVQYLHERGYDRACGFDPYGRADAFGNPAVLERGPFDFLVLQDVLEHVEDPAELLARVDAHLAPGGIALVGTPNAERIDLARSDEFANELHAPYHRVIVTPDVLKRLGEGVGWTPQRLILRGYHDTPWLGLNPRAGREYQRAVDDTLDAVLEPLRVGLALRSPRFLWLAHIGYLFSHRADMAVVFRKQARR